MKLREVCCPFSQTIPTSVKTRVPSWEGDTGQARGQTRAADASPFPLHRHDIRDIDFHCRRLMNQTDPDH